MQMIYIVEHYVIHIYRCFTGWKSLMLSMFFVFTAMLCKEQGITATAVCVLYEIFVVQKVKISFQCHTFIISSMAKNYTNNICNFT